MICKRSLRLNQSRSRLRSNFDEHLGTKSQVFERFFTFTLTSDYFFENSFELVYTDTEFVNIFDIIYYNITCYNIYYNINVT